MEVVLIFPFLIMLIHCACVHVWAFMPYKLKCYEFSVAVLEDKHLIAPSPLHNAFKGGRL